MRCTLSTWVILCTASAWAMTFEVRPIPELAGAGSSPERLVLSGRIELGDADRLEQALARLPVHLLDGVLLDSPGGNVQEALWIADVLRSLLVDVVVVPPYRCTSACFYLYAGAPTRYAVGPPRRATMGVHRPYPVGDVLVQLDFARLNEREDRSFAFLRRWLDRRGVPPSIVDRKFSTPSTTMYMLRQHELDALGRRAAWYQQWVETHCPGFATIERTMLETPTTAVTKELRSSWDAATRCEIRHVDAERVARQSRLRDDAER